MSIDFYTIFYATRDAMILWKKRKQHAQGKINLQVSDDDGWMWTVEECDEKIREYQKAERWIWNQLPELARLEDSGADYVVDSVRVLYEPL